MELALLIFIDSLDFNVGLIHFTKTVKRMQHKPIMPALVFICITRLLNRAKNWKGIS